MNKTLANVSAVSATAYFLIQKKKKQHEFVVGLFFSVQFSHVHTVNGKHYFSIVYSMVTIITNYELLICLLFQEKQQNV